MTQGFSSADWDAIPDVALDGRSILKYPSKAPDGRDWHDYFASLPSARTVIEPEPGEDGEDGSGDAAVFKDYGPVSITQEAEEFDDPISPLATWVKRAHDNGWEILSIAHALSFAEGKPFGTGEKAGQPRPNYHVDTQWAHFKRGRDLASVIYTVINGTPRGARTGRFFNGERLGDADMRTRMK